MLGVAVAIAISGRMNGAHNQNRTRGEPNDTLGCAAESNVFEASMAARRDNNQVNVDLASQLTDLIERSALQGMDIFPGHWRAIHFRGIIQALSRAPRNFQIGRNPRQVGQARQRVIGWNNVNEMKFSAK